MLYMDLPVSIKTLKYKTDKIDFDYPQVEGMKSKEIEDRINKKIYELMISVTRELTRPDLVTIIDGSYEIKLNQRKLLSLTLLAMGDFHGAHPMTIIRALTFDIETGGLFELNELFVANSGYLKTLTNLTFEQLKSRKYPLFNDVPHVVRPNQDYFITDKNIIIFFQIYEIAPYAAGFPYATIALYKIERYFKKDSILERLMYM